VVSELATQQKTILVSNVVPMKKTSDNERHLVILVLEARKKKHLPSKLHSS
jgi:hypothetical protein